MTYDALGNKKMIGAIFLFFGLVFLLLFSMSMNRNLSHDEHLYIASSALLADKGLLPYVHYPYVQSPTLVFIYALLFSFSDYKLLTARIFSVLSATGSLMLIFALTLHWFRSSELSPRLLVAVAGVLILMTNPLFIYTSGSTWSHDWAVFLALLAFAFHSYTLFHTRERKWLWFSGLCVGLAATTRLSFLTLLAPFLLIIWFSPYAIDTLRHKVNQALVFCSGVLVACLPTLYLFALAPQQFIFGNINYHQFNTLYKQTNGFDEPMELTEKLIFLIQLILTKPSHLVIVLLFLIAIGTGRALMGTKQRLELTFVLCLLLFILVGVFAPTPSQPQYFYFPFPFLILGLLQALSRWPTSKQKIGLTLLASATALSVALAIPQYGAALLNLFAPHEWFPIKIHKSALRISSLVGEGKVLTFTPIQLLEGGGEIYPEFATGSFIWRVADFVPPERRDALDVIGQEEFESFLQKKDTPRAFYVGYHNADAVEEMPFVSVAQQQGYVPVKLDGDEMLWLSPLVEWGESIRLGGYLWPNRPLQPGDSQRVTFYLQNIAPIDRNLNMQLRLVGHDGSEVWRDEGWPWGSPTSTWKQGDVWPDGHELSLPADTPLGYYRFEMSFYDPETLEHLPAIDPNTSQALGDTVIVDYLLVGDLPDSLASPLSPPAILGEQIRLLGTDQNIVSASDKLKVRLFWQSQAKAQDDYTVFVHLIAPDGQLIAQQDQQPLGGFFPTSFWRANEVIPDDYELQLPPVLPPGSYEIRVGMYDPITLERLPVTIGGEAGGDFVTVGQVEIEN